ncbi:hypothetical protein ACIRF8_15325 [Streptomyces sp. NPDC102406]|uniref:hypothetical protein n=1 Tax=Streptomyces sp. NPDC102406 TaxID=3366171 RepID=UPI0037F9C400
MTTEITRHVPLPSDPRTSPLPAAAVSAIERLAVRLSVPGAMEAAARYGVASFRTMQMSHWMDARPLSDAEFDDFEFLQDVMRESRALLAAAGLLRLIGGAR